jgi:hypothetical protein
VGFVRIVTVVEALTDVCAALPLPALSSSGFFGGSGLLIRTMKIGQGAVISTFNATLPTV